MEDSLGAAGVARCDVLRARIHALFSYLHGSSIASSTVPLPVHGDPAANAVRSIALSFGLFL